MELPSRQARLMENCAAMIYIACAAVEALTPPGPSLD
jgi:hypothetical protein